MHYGAVQLRAYIPRNTDLFRSLNGLQEEVPAVEVAQQCGKIASQLGKSPYIVS